MPDNDKPAVPLTPAEVAAAQARCDALYGHVSGEFRAYYYSLTATGALPIDGILKAIARAGKAFHHTQDWREEMHDGISPMALIQDAANAAAATQAATHVQLSRALETIRRQAARIAELEALLKLRQLS